jgi:hypothetical protein
LIHRVQSELIARRRVFQKNRRSAPRCASLGTGSKIDFSIRGNRDNISLTNRPADDDLGSPKRGSVDLKGTRVLKGVT